MRRGETLQRPAPAAAVTRPDSGHTRGVTETLAPTLLRTHLYTRTMIVALEQFCGRATRIGSRQRIANETVSTSSRTQVRRNLPTRNKIQWQSPINTYETKYSISETHKYETKFNRRNPPIRNIIQSQKPTNTNPGKLFLEVPVQCAY